MTTKTKRTRSKGTSTLYIRGIPKHLKDAMKIAAIQRGMGFRELIIDIMRKEFTPAPDETVPYTDLVEVLWTMWREAINGSVRDVTARRAYSLLSRSNIPEGGRT